MSVAEQLSDSSVDTTMDLPVIVTPKHSGVPYSTDNPLEGYFTRKVPSCYSDPQYHHHSHGPLEAMWKSQGPPAHFAPWLHGGRDPREIALELEREWQKKLAAAASGVVVPITEHPRWGNPNDQLSEPTPTDAFTAERMRS